MIFQSSVLRDVLVLTTLPIGFKLATFNDRTSSVTISFLALEILLTGLKSGSVSL
jgi:hypothetical protein